MAAISQTMFSNAFSWMEIYVSIKMSLKFVPKGPINNISALGQIMAWRRTMMAYFCDAYMRLSASVS